MNKRETIYYALRVLMTNGEKGCDDHKFMGWDWGEITSETLKERALIVLTELIEEAHNGNG